LKKDFALEFGIDEITAKDLLEFQDELVKRKKAGGT
jgi:hypothetical protein